MKEVFAEFKSVRLIAIYKKNYQSLSHCSKNKFSIKVSVFSECAKMYFQDFQKTHFWE